MSPKVACLHDHACFGGVVAVTVQSAADVPRFLVTWSRSTRRLTRFAQGNGRRGRAGRIKIFPPPRPTGRVKAERVRQRVWAIPATEVDCLKAAPRPCPRLRPGQKRAPLAGGQANTAAPLSKGSIPTASAPPLPLLRPPPTRAQPPVSSACPPPGHGRGVDRSPSGRQGADRSPPWLTPTDPSRPPPLRSRNQTRTVRSAPPARRPTPPRPSRGAEVVGILALTAEEHEEHPVGPGRRLPRQAGANTPHEGPFGTRPPTCHPPVPVAGSVVPIDSVVPPHAFLQSRGT